MEDNVQEMRRQSTAWKKKFPRHTSNKGQYLKHRKNLWNWIIREQTTWLKNVPKTLRDPYQRRYIYIWQISVWKYVPHNTGIQIKTWDIPRYLLEWPVSGQKATPSAGKDEERQKLSQCWWKCRNTATLGDFWKCLTKLYILLSEWSSNPVPCYLPKESENSSPYKNLHTNVYSKFIHNFQKMEETKMCFSRLNG